jgi:thiamine-monophosphate kinase
VAAGLTLSKHFSRYALMDSSDGLADALLKIAQASGKRLIAQQDQLPIHPEVAAYYVETPDRILHSVLYGGEDFELVATVPEVTREILAHFQVIGRVEDADTQSPVGAWLALDVASDVSDAARLIPLHLEQTYQHFGASHAG